MTSPNEMLLWDDNPSKVDLLGFADLAHPVAATVRREHLDPVCVGIFGSWGSGKSTVLNLVVRALVADAGESVVVVPTQPWAYDPATDPKATLIGAVLSAVRDRIAEDETAFGQLKETLQGLASRIRWSRAIRLAASGALTASLPTLPELESLFGKEDQVTEPSLEGFQEEFGDLLADDALSGVERVVVVVDDLDRCLPGTVVDTLEAIKLFLDVPKMAFIVAADERPVSFAIAKHIGAGDGALEIAERYLDKIVQVPVRVPALSQAEVEAYVAQLLLWHRLPESDRERIYETVLSTCAEARSKGSGSLIDGIADDIDGGDADLHTARQFAPILHDELQGNPRRIKRLLNAYWVRASIATSRGIDFEVAAFAKLVLLEEVFPTDFGTVLSWLSAGTLEDQLERLESDEGEFPPHLRRWANLDPPLAALDVGRYLVLAAALTGTTVTASSLPPELRDVAAQLLATADGARKEAQAAVNDLSEDERSTLAHHLGEVVRLQPGRRSDIAESLMAVVGNSEAVATIAASELKKLPASEVEPSLIIHLLPTGGTVLSSMRDVVELWRASGGLADDATKAAEMALGVS